jgi:predicted dehydrogenase
VSAPIPIGLVGAGKHGERYLRHAAEDVPELRVALVCRRDAEAGHAQAARTGARFVADFRELVVSPEIEAVIAAAPPTLNLEIARLAAGAGKALLIEKPLAANLAEAAEICRVAERVPAMVAQTLRFNSVVRAVRAALERVGPIHQIHLSQRFQPSRLAWLDDPRESGGGIILHTGVHGFDLLRFFTGSEASAVFAVARRVGTRRTEDNFSALVAFDGVPLTATVSASRSTASRSGAIEISGERGQIYADHVLGHAAMVSGAQRTPLAVEPEAPSVRETLRAFAKALRSGSPIPIPLGEGLRAMAMVDACYRSAASGRPDAVTPVQGVL